MRGVGKLTVMPKRSAGLLLYRRTPDLEVLLVHPGGPFFAKKDDGVWSVPKGEYEPDEDALTAALREFEEELGSAPPETASEPIPLGEVKQRAGKVVTAWAAEGDLDTSTVASNTFEMEWPPRSGRTAEFPEIDRAEWFDLDTARTKILPAQQLFLDRLAESAQD
jgi:predicted NUDIX family NTP pyrophosphohydrolase